MVSEYKTFRHVSFSPEAFTFYYRPISTKDGTPLVWKRHTLTRQNKTKGKISKNAKRRISKAFNWLLFYSSEKTIASSALAKRLKFRLNFITLTLAATQIHSDKEIKTKLLNNFLTVLRYKYKCSNYIWKAERQKNGNIHFHIITDTFCHYKSIQNDWNRIQNTLGYIDRFKLKYGHTQPHSTEVKAVRKVNSLRAYVAKYFLKNDEEKPINGRLWYASQSLLNPPSITACEIDIEFEKLYEFVSKNNIRPFSTDFSEFYLVPLLKLVKELPSNLVQFIKSKIINHWQSLHDNVPDFVNYKLSTL